MRRQIRGRVRPRMGGYHDGGICGLRGGELRENALRPHQPLRGGDHLQRRISPGRKALSRGGAVPPAPILLSAVGVQGPAGGEKPQGAILRFLRGSSGAGRPRGSGAHRRRPHRIPPRNAEARAQKHQRAPLRGGREIHDAGRLRAPQPRNPQKQCGGEEVRLPAVAPRPHKDEHGGTQARLPPHEPACRAGGDRKEARRRGRALPRDRDPHGIGRDPRGRQGYRAPHGQDLERQFAAGGLPCALRVACGAAQSQIPPHGLFFRHPAGSRKISSIPRRSATCSTERSTPVRPPSKRGTTSRRDTTSGWTSFAA